MDGAIQVIRGFVTALICLGAVSCSATASHPSPSGAASIGDTFMAVVAVLRDSIGDDLAIDPRPLPSGVSLADLFATEIPLNSNLKERLRRDDPEGRVRARQHLLRAAGIPPADATALEPCVFAFGVAPPPPGSPPPTPERQRLLDRCREIGEFQVAVVAEPVSRGPGRYRVGVIVLRPHAYEEFQVTLERSDDGRLSLSSFEPVHWIYS